MSDELGKCPSCDEPGEVGQPCEGVACRKRGYHFVPKAYWDRAHAKPNQSPDPLIGQLIGDFLVVDTLGAGGFGKVCLALQSPLFRLRGALKLLEFPNDDPKFQQALLEKFQGEAEVLAELSHPNIVRLIKYGIHRNRPYLVMEYLERGLTLRDEIFSRARAKKGFSHQELRHIFHQMLNGLEAAHDRKIIHRDLKPENIMLQRVVGNPAHVRILDFGIAKFVEGQTDTKWPLGSPSYMAPEQVSLQNLGTWTDLYALGVMFFEMVTGRRPFPGESDEAIMGKKLGGSFDPFEQVADLEIPQPTVDFLRRALARKPQDRQQTVAEFRRDLDAALDALEGHPGAIGEGGRALTHLLESKDIVELGDVAADGGGSGPPEIPGEASAGAAGRGRGRLFALVALVALLGAGAFLVRGQFGGVADEDAGADRPARDHALVAARADGGPTDAGRVNAAVVDTGVDDAGPADAVAGAEADAVDAPEDAAELDAGPALPAWAMTQISAGKYHTCGVRADGKLRCWGGNFDGELGLGHTRKIGDDEAPNRIAALDFGRPVTQVVAAGDRQAGFTCALLEGGKVRCWGANKHGQLGYGHTRNLGDDETLDKLPDVGLRGSVTQIAAGASKFGSHVCALMDDHTMRCWGSGKFGMLGYGHTNVIGDDELPSTVGKVAVGGPVAAIAAGKYNTCAILEDRSLRCWGWNAQGQLGLGHTRDVGDDEIPASVDPIDVGGEVAQVSVGRRHMCAVLDDGRVRCWGWNNHGQLGLGNTDNIGDDETPASVAPVDLSGPAEQVACGSLHSCALLEDGKIQCWGDNKFGQLGYGHDHAVGDKAPPKSVGTVYLGEPATAVVAGSYHTCALLDSGQVRCWGYNDQGQLGYGHTNLIGDDEMPGSVSNVPISD